MSSITSSKPIASQKQPVFFVSHGGPTFMYREETGSDKGAFDTTAKLGYDIKTKYKPDYIVVLSGHWQPEYTSSASLNELKIAVPPELSDLNTVPDNHKLYENSLIYDFYGFPRHMYNVKFKNYVTKDVVKRLDTIVQESGNNIKLVPEVRGVDHGTWVPLKVAKLDDYTDAPDGLNHIPLVQMSILPSSPKKPSNPVSSFFASRPENMQTSKNGNEDTVDTFENHFHKLGPILQKIRQDNGLVICSGMSVHNLQDLGYTFMDPFGNKFPYTDRFNQYLFDMITFHKKKLEQFTTEKEATNEITPTYLLDKLTDLGKIPELKRLLYQAHAPTIDHFLPFVAACGSLDNLEVVEELYNNKWGSLGWGIYQFGVPVDKT
ncbi:hypothetical protein ACO0QE_003488 [Hanseniaspora vineae]